MGKANSGYPELARLPLDGRMLVKRRLPVEEEKYVKETVIQFLPLF
jgi:hypothetical protein